MTMVSPLVKPQTRFARPPRAGLWLMAPAAAVMILAFGAPMIFSAWYSFTGWSLVRPGSASHFVGFSNYWKVLRDREYWQAISVTVIYAVTAVGLEGVIGTALAVLLNQEFFGRGLFRSLMLIPMVITPAVVGMYWKLFFEEGDGLFNYFLVQLGVSPVAWLGLSLALTSVIILDVWQSTPFFMLIVLAGLQSIDPNILSAAEIDGATAWQKFRYIVAPHLVPYTMIAAAFRIIGALADFDKIYLLTFGGPGAATTTISLYAYNRGFKVFDVGQTTAISWLFVIMVLVVTSPLLLRLLRGASVARH